MDEDRDPSAFDPAKLLPFSRVLDESNPEAQKLPRGGFVTGMDDFYTGTNLF